MDATHRMASYRRALHRCGLECCRKDGEGLHSALMRALAMHQSADCSRCWPNECRSESTPHLRFLCHSAASIKVCVGQCAGCKSKSKTGGTPSRRAFGAVSRSMQRGSPPELEPSPQGLVSGPSRIRTSGAAPAAWNPAARPVRCRGRGGSTLTMADVRYEARVFGED